MADEKGNVLGKGVYRNAKDAREFAEKTAAGYGTEQCQAACETTGSMGIAAIEAFEAEGIQANTYHV